MLTSIQFTLQDLFWDYLVLELSLLGLILDNVYYSGGTKTSGWWTYGLTWYIYIKAGKYTESAEFTLNLREIHELMN